MVYIKWNCQGLESGNAELREGLAKQFMLAEKLYGIHKQLDPQLVGYEGIGRELKACAEGAEEEARRVRNESSALEGAITVYAGAERAALRLSESLPTGITERSLVFEDWFCEMMR